MSVSHFRKLFVQFMTSRNGVIVKKDVWFMPWSPLDECVTAVHLQQSNFSKLFYINISVFARGAWGWNPPEVIRLWERAGSTVTSRRQPTEFNAACDLTSELSDDERTQRLLDFFEYLDSLSGRAKSRGGLRMLAEDKLIRLTQPALAELDKLDAEAIN